MKARNLVSMLQKQTSIDTEVTVTIENREYAITGVTNTVGKKILTAEAIQVLPEDVEVEDIEEVEVQQEETKD